MFTVELQGQVLNRHHSLLKAGESVSEQLRLLCVLAHPDDESLGMGGTLVKYALEGIETYLVTATRGERGRFGSGIEFPGFAAVGKLREAELLAAAKELGLREVRFLDYMDGEVDQAKPAEIIAKIVAELRRVRPHIVLTFGPEGAYGHPDHIAICQFATAATICAADPSYPAGGPALPPHRVSKLYYMAWSHAKWEAYQAGFRDLKSKVDGIERRATPWPDWALTTSWTLTNIGRPCGGRSAATRLSLPSIRSWRRSPRSTIARCGERRNSIVFSAW